MSSQALRISTDQPYTGDSHIPLEAVSYPTRQQQNSVTASAESLLPEQTETIKSPRGNEYLDQEASLGQLSKHSSGWDIFILAAFAVLHLLFIAAILVLSQWDKRDSGFYIAKSASPYIWKFGPTLIFVLVLAFWRQLDLRIKYRTPWIEMLNGPSPASKTILLDYITPILPSAIFTALRNRHWDVAASVGVFVLLKLAVVLSTGLLAVNSANWTTRQANISLALSPSADTRLAAYDRVGLSYAGVLQRGLDWPDRILSYAAFQEPIINEANLPSEATVTADVLAFYPELNCEPVNITSTFIFSDPTVTTIVGRAEPTNTPNRKLSISVTSKRFSGTTTVSARGCSPDQISCEPVSITAHVSDLSSFQWNFQQSTIDSGIFAMVLALETKSDPSSIAQNYSQGLYQSTLRGNGWVQRQAWSTAILCSANYSIETGQLTINTTGLNEPQFKKLSLPQSHSGRHIDGYNLTTLSSDVYTLAQQTARYLVLSFPNQTVPFDWSSYADIWFWLGSQNRGDLDLSQLRDLTQLQALVNQAFKGLASFWVGQWLSFPDHQTTNGSYAYLESRLRVSPLAEWGMVGLIAGSLVCVIILFVSHLRTDSSYPMTMIDDSVIAKRSLDFMHYLKGLNPSEEAMRSDKVTNLSLSVSPFDNVIKIEPAEKNKTEQSELDQTSNSTAETSNTHLWRPMSTKMWFLAISIILAACAIVALEMVQRVSDRSSNGLVLKTNTVFVRDLINLAPVSVLVIIATLFSSTESMLALISPYILLKKTPTKLRTVNQSPLTELLPFAIFSHLKSGQFGIASVLLASLLGSILTITSSGLLSTHIISTSMKTSVTALDEFDLSTNLSVTGKGSREFTFLQREGAGYIAGTFNEFVYPLFTLNDTDPTVSRLRSENRSSSIAVDMPVLRPSLNCSLIPQTNIQVSALNTTIWHWYGSIYPWANISYTSSLPDVCQFAGSAYSKSQQYLVQSPYSWTVHNDRTTSCANILAVKGVDASNQSNIISPSYTRVDEYPAGCPSLAILVGNYTLFQTETSTTSMLVCNQMIEQIPATLTFNVPSLALNLSAEPVLRTNEAKVVNRPTWNFVNLFQGYTDGVDSLAKNTTGDIQVDSFFATLINNTNTPVTGFLGHENVDKLLNATQHLYRVYVAQRIGNEMRVTAQNQSTVNAGSSLQTIGSSLDAQISSPSMLGIVQNRSSKIALQGILGLMIVCLVASIPDCRAAGKTLGLSPVTLVGRLSLLNGSTLVDRIDDSKSSKETYREWKDMKLKLGRRIQQAPEPAALEDTSTVTTKSKKSKALVYGEGDIGIDLAELVQP